MSWVDVNSASFSIQHIHSSILSSSQWASKCLLRGNSHQNPVLVASPRTYRRAKRRGTFAVSSHLSPWHWIALLVYTRFFSKLPLRLLDLEYQTPSIALPSPCPTLKDETRRAFIAPRVLPPVRSMLEKNGFPHALQPVASTAPLCMATISSFNPYSTVVRYKKEQRFALPFFCIKSSLISTYI